MESRCLRFLTSSSPAARRGAAEVLGNLAGVNGDRIDLVRAHEALQKLSGDADEGVLSAVNDGLDDVLHSLRLHKKLQ